MRRNDLKSMSLDELWNLHEEIVAELTDKMGNEKARLEEQLRKIETGGNVAGLEYERRPYPKVLPKIGIQTIQLRLGPAAGNNPVG
jgi:DNA-binding protein H-NS